MNDLDDLYREVILEHHRSPRGRKPLERIDVEAHGHNPSCGDEVDLRLTLDGDRIVGVQVEGQGCAISTASGSILAQEIEGKHVEEVRGLFEAFQNLLRGHELPADLDLGDLEALAGVRQFPVRVKCAMLPWTALDEALARRGGREAESREASGGEVSSDPSAGREEVSHG